MSEDRHDSRDGYREPLNGGVGLIQIFRTWCLTLFFMLVSTTRTMAMTSLGGHVCRVSHRVAAVLI